MDNNPSYSKIISMSHIFLLLICCCCFVLLFYMLDFSQINNFIPRPAFTLESMPLTHKTLLNRLPDFQYLINNEICGTDHVKAMLIVTSHAGDIENRSAMRRAYPASELLRIGIRRVFLLAVANSKSLQHKYSFVSQNALIDENKRYFDIVQGNFLEAYKNLTLKHLMGLAWAITYCPEATYIIKMDDDIIVDLYQLLDVLSGHERKEHLLAGYVMKGMIPVREPANKWFVTKAEYPHSSYPPFLSGWLYVTTVHTAKSLIQVSEYLPYFWIDDTYITGILATEANIHHTDLSSYFTTHFAYLECCLTPVKEQKYVCDFIVGPNGGIPDLLLRFQRHAQKCFIKKCPHRPENKRLFHYCISQGKPRYLGPGHGEVKQIQIS